MNYNYDSDFVTDYLEDATDWVAEREADEMHDAEMLGEMLAASKDELERWVILDEWEVMADEWEVIAPD